MTDTNPLQPSPGEVKVRLYGQGLGDCFLLAFPPSDSDSATPSYLVIDCGAAKSTPDRRKRAREVVRNIREATNGHLQALVITHQHFDHISGFQDAWQEWGEIKVDAVYLPWTERTAEDGEVKGTEAFRQVLTRAAQKAVEEAEKQGLLDTRPGFRAEADFLGVAASTGNADDGPSDMDEVMRFVRERWPNITYFSPGDVFRVPGSDSHGYVLGPPLSEARDHRGKRYIELLADHAPGAMYDYASVGMKADHGKPGGDRAFALSDDHSLPAMASGLMSLGTASAADHRGDDEAFSPFAQQFRLDWDDALETPFFQQRYGSDQKGEEGAWRRADYDWLLGAANLALRAGEFTNNVSLVLAFDVPGLPDSSGGQKMLLFPGDAQIGNWLSWHTIKGWNLKEGASPVNPPQGDDKQTLMENLLSRVAFYKVGHHGSHNATAKNAGLELMTHPELVAYVPVSVPVAQDLMGYCPMPFYPVLRALQRRTNGRVFLPSGEPLHPLPNDRSSVALRSASGIEVADPKLDFGPMMKDGKIIENAMPLYLELTVKA